MPKKKKDTDWRSRPRKPADQRRTESISIRVTEAEKRAVARRAEAAGLTLRDFLIRCALTDGE